MSELTVVVQDHENVRARTQDGAEVSGYFQLNTLHRNVISVFEDWLRECKISQRRELEALGALLYTTIFTGQMETFFEQTLDRTLHAGHRLRLQLSFQKGAADLASLPWEYLYRPETETAPGYFLSTAVNLVLSRYLPLVTGRRTLQPEESPLRILIVVAKPNGLGPVLEEQTVADIQELVETYPIKVNILENPTVDNFLVILEDARPHVVHFMGHGRFSQTEGKGEIALLAPDETSALWIGDREFTEFFVQMRSIPRLIVLHLCEGGSIDFTANFAGLAPQLIRAGIQAVVAMQYRISNKAAIAFSRAFYRELASGEPVDNAVQSGRYRITLSVPRAYDSRDFGTPVLYMHSRDGIIQPGRVT